MSTISYQTPLRGGVNLVRHYNGDFNPDQQVGPASYYQQLEDQLVYQALDYYTPKDTNGWPIGPNKFLRHVVWHIYCPTTPMPTPAGLPPGSAWCEPPNGAGELHIHVRYADPNWDAYKLPACLSHETGHAFHFWCGLLFAGTEPAAIAEVQRTWERMVSSNHTTFNANAAPWRKADGGVEDGREQIANSYRCHMGVACTRGVSGPGTTDPVIAGFEDPKAHPDWKKALQLLPELAGYLRTEAIAPGSLTWKVDPSGWAWWEFRRARDGWRVALADYPANGGWLNRPGDSGDWSRFYPTYNVT